MPYYVESDIKRCLIAYKRISGAYPDYISELLELNSSQHSRNTRGANLNILPRRYNRAKEGGRRFSVTILNVGITFRLRSVPLHL